MNLSERFGRLAAAQGVTVDLGQGPVPVTGWAFDSDGATGHAVFGPYPSSVTADGVTVDVDGGSEWRAFSSRLVLPAGQRFQSTVRLGLRRDS